MSTVINVTAEHINNGERESNTRCAIALAAEDAFPGADVTVGGNCFDILGDPWEAATVFVPVEVENFILAFDRCDDVEPFSFTVDYPKEVA